MCVWLEIPVPKFRRYVPGPKIPSSVLFEYSKVGAGDFTVVFYVFFRQLFPVKMTQKGDVWEDSRAFFFFLTWKRFF